MSSTVPECLLCATPVWPGEALAVGRWHDPTGAVRSVHTECALRSVVGGIGHLRDHARHCLAEGDPDAGMSYRDSALAVAEWVKLHGIP